MKCPICGDNKTRFAEKGEITVIFLSQEKRKRDRKLSMPAVLCVCDCGHHYVDFPRKEGSSISISIVPD